SRSARANPPEPEMTPNYLPRLPESVGMGTTTSDNDSPLTARVAERASDLYSTAKGTTSEMIGRARDTSRHVHARASEQARHGQEAVVHYYDAEPLLVGAAALALGAAIGAAIPTTAAEHQRLGPYRDQLLGKATSAAEEGVREAHEFIGEKANEIQKSLSGDAPTT
ncbi:MAG: hypothetical protein WBG86_22545, partial [Polyangiales bacterium]